MPLTKSAKKSLKISRVKMAQNRANEIKLEKVLRTAKKENISSVISLIDKAAKTGLIHKNKAARLKSGLTKKFGTPKSATAKRKKTNVKVAGKKKKETSKKVSKKK